MRPDKERQRQQQTQQDGGSICLRFEMGINFSHFFRRHNWTNLDSADHLFLSLECLWAYEANDKQQTTNAFVAFVLGWETSLREGAREVGESDTPATATGDVSLVPSLFRTGNRAGGYLSVCVSVLVRLEKVTRIFVSGSLCFYSSPPWSAPSAVAPSTAATLLFDRPHFLSFLFHLFSSLALLIFLRHTLTHTHTYGMDTQILKSKPHTGRV